jgi:acetoin utilization deacetylase AcuC-like enzyme
MLHKIAVIRDPRYLEHTPGHTHPEHPSRLRAIYEMLDRRFPDGLITLEPQPAAMDELELVHTPSYIKKVLMTAEHQFTSLSPDTPASSKTYLAAWLAAGGCLEALRAVWSGRFDTCFALIRPPGHHALPDRAGGFCIFNNVGIMARYARMHLGVRKILIIDWDIHHGNGLNDLFYGDHEVFYFSTHDKLLYPYTGDFEDVGIGAGAGFTLNVPLPRSLEDQDMLDLYRAILTPLMERLRPELILVDAGFDAHHSDPIGRSCLTEEAFAGLTRLLLQLRARVGSPPMLFVLEGGYDPLALAACVERVLQVIREPATVPSEGGPPSGRAGQLIDEVMKIHRRYKVWVE